MTKWKLLDRVVLILPNDGHAVGDRGVITNFEEEGGESSFFVALDDGRETWFGRDDLRKLSPLEELAECAE